MPTYKDTLDQDVQPGDTMVGRGKVWRCLETDPSLFTIGRRILCIRLLRGVAKGPHLLIPARDLLKVDPETIAKFETDERELGRYFEFRIQDKVAAMREAMKPARKARTESLIERGIMR